MTNDRFRGERRSKLADVRLWLWLVAAAIWSIPMAGAAFGAEANTIDLSIEPAVPKVDEPFRVTATGTVNATQSSNVYLVVVLGPGDRTCSSSGALEQARGENGDRSAGWRVWWDSFLGGNSPSGVPYEESKVFSGQPLGRYRICAYTIGQGEGPDPYASTSLDLTVGGTCPAATQRAAAHLKVVARAKKRALRARKTVRKAVRKGNLKRLKAARRKVKVTRRALRNARSRSVNARAARKVLCGVLPE